MAAQGYPGTPKKGGSIHGIAAAEAAGAKVFHAGTALTPMVGWCRTGAACST
jgi:phosphoribosylamine--glycine ligase